MIELFIKKREDEQNGHYDFMRKNISRERKEEDLSLGQYGTAQLIKRGDKIRIQRINNYGHNKERLSELQQVSMSQHSTKGSKNRVQTEQVSINHYY